jgi:hypothetical protein
MLIQMYHRYGYAQAPPPWPRGSEQTGSRGGIDQNMSINYWWRPRPANLLQHPRQTARHTTRRASMVSWRDVPSGLLQNSRAASAVLGMYRRGRPAVRGLAGRWGEQTCPGGFEEVVH